MDIRAQFGPREDAESTGNTPPRPRSAEPMWNVPVPLTPLLGREEQVEAICACLRQPAIRLLTLVGAGGVGKTRLGQEVALSMRSFFPDGICFVELAAILDPALTVPTIAMALGIQEIGSLSIVEQVKIALREKQMLLLLDNFEQVGAAAPQLEELLVACPLLTIMVTSRMVLRVQPEYLFPLVPLAVPDLARLPAPESLAHTASVALFMQRAQAMQPTFQLTPENASTIAEICVRLDGLPLALELAAARIGVLTPQALLARLSSRLALLTRGAWDLPERQQTLRKTLAWSYNLLSLQEQRLFRQLSVFVGNWTLEAAEALWDGTSDPAYPGIEALDGIASLLEKSFLAQQVTPESGEPRFAILETIREYGHGCLQEHGELTTSQRAHALYYLTLVEKGGPAIETLRLANWMDRLEQEHDNIRAALRWFIEQKDAEKALRLGAALCSFWETRGHVNEGRQWLDEALAINSEVATPVRAKALKAAAQLASIQGDNRRMEAFAEESLLLFRALEDKRGMAFALCRLGVAALYSRSDFATAYACFEGSLSLARGLQDLNGIGEALWMSGVALVFRGDYPRARPLLEEALGIARELGDPQSIGSGLLWLSRTHFFLGEYRTARLLIEENLEISRRLGFEGEGGISEALVELARQFSYQGDHATARPLAEEGLALCRKQNFRLGLIMALGTLGRILLSQGGYETAFELHEESLNVSLQLGFKWTIAASLERLAQVVAVRDYTGVLRLPVEIPFQASAVWAARLLGAASALRKTTGATIPPVDRSDYEQTVTKVRARLGEKACATAWAEGEAMTPEQLMTIQGQQMLSQPQPRSGPMLHNTLTRREVEVLQLVAQGLTDTQIAEHLVISSHTIHAHLKSIYSKIGVTSRSAATRFAFEQKLISP